MPGGVDPFLRQKWEYVFGTFFDLTKDGILEWCDFECLLEKIKATRGENSIDYQKELKAMKQIWDELQKVADENSDSMVTEQEWFQMWVNTFGDGGTRKADSTWQRLYQDYMFQLIDTSGL